MTWRKSWCEQNLEPGGTKRSLTPEQRSVWDDILDLAMISPVTGRLRMQGGVAYHPSQLAEMFNTPEPVIKKALAVFMRRKMLLPSGEISNWKTYQSDYMRTKQYRNNPKEQEKAKNKVKDLVGETARKMGSQRK